MQTSAPNGPNDGAGGEIPLKDLTLDRLIDWLAQLAVQGVDWSPCRAEIKRRVEEVAEHARRGAAPLPPVAISNPGPSVARTFLTVEIRGGNPTLAKTCRESLEMEIERAFWFLRTIQTGRKGVPELILHPFTVEA